MNKSINESLNISLSKSEISNSNSNISSRNKISLKDLLKIALTELDSEINSFNRKNKPISDIKEVITIQTTKKFVSCDDENNIIKLISFNTKESNRNMIKYNIDSLKTIISKVNKTLTRYYGSLIIEPIRKEYSGYISLKYLGRVENLKEGIFKRKKYINIEPKIPFKQAYDLASRELKKNISSIKEDINKNSFEIFPYQKSLKRYKEDYEKDFNENDENELEILSYDAWKAVGNARDRELYDKFDKAISFIEDNTNKVLSQKGYKISSHGDWDDGIYYLEKGSKVLQEESINLFDEAYLSNELEYMYLEEKEFIKEINNLLNENSDVLDKKYKLPKQKGKNFVNGKEDEKEKLSTRKLIKSIYNLKDDDFVEGKFFPLFTKALVRVVGFIAITASTYAIANKAVKTKSVDSETKEKKGEDYAKKKMEQYKKFKQAKVVAITLFTAMSAYVINRSLKKNMRDAQRKRLLDFYENKIEYIDNKIESATTNEEKYELKKLRTTLVRDSEKIKVFASNAHQSK